MTETGTLIDQRIWTARAGTGNIVQPNFNTWARPHRRLESDRIMAGLETGTSLVTEYIEKEGHAIHDVFAVGSSFNESKSRYEAKDKHQ